MSLGKEMSLILGWDSHLQVLKHSAVNCLEETPMGKRKRDILIRS